MKEPTVQTRSVKPSDEANEGARQLEMAFAADAPPDIGDERQLLESQ